MPVEDGASILWVQDLSRKISLSPPETIRVGGNTLCLVEGRDEMWTQLSKERYALLIIDDLNHPYRGAGLAELNWLAERSPHPPELILSRFIDEEKKLQWIALEPRDEGFEFRLMPGSASDINLGTLSCIVTSPLKFSSEKVGGEEDPIRLAFRGINATVLEKFAQHPHLLSGMHWRDFEQLVAELFRRSGWTVSLTAGSRDGGVDLYAARHTSFGPLLYVVECKRHSFDRPVGPALVRHLRGVVDRERATAGVLVTTSYFSPGAQEEQRTIPCQIALRDNANVRTWLRGVPVG